MPPYLATSPTFEGRVTVPVLWDKETRRIVNNSEDDICRMFTIQHPSSDPQIRFHSLSFAAIRVKKCPRLHPRPQRFA